MFENLAASWFYAAGIQETFLSAVKAYLCERYTTYGVPTNIAKLAPYLYFLDFKTRFATENRCLFANSADFWCDIAYLEMFNIDLMLGQ